MSKYHAKRRSRRMNLPKKRGKKRCPRCNHNTMVNGYCPDCKYGDKPVVELDPRLILKSVSLPALAIPIILYKREKQRQTEDKKEE